MKIAIDYKPEALEVGDKPKFVSATDGDTPTLTMPVRMLGMDAPELHYGGATESNPGKYDDAFSKFVSKQGAGLSDELKDYLAERLDDAVSTRHIQAGKVAFEHFEKIREERLRRVSDKTGKLMEPRRLFTMVSICLRRCETDPPRRSESDPPGRRWRHLGRDRC